MTLVSDGERQLETLLENMSVQLVATELMERENLDENEVEKGS
jgi:hypothetical protein